MIENSCSGGSGEGAAYGEGGQVPGLIRAAVIIEEIVEIGNLFVAHGIVRRDTRAADDSLTQTS